MIDDALILLPVSTYTPVCSVARISSCGAVVRTPGPSLPATAGVVTSHLQSVPGLTPTLCSIP